MVLNSSRRLLIGSQIEEKLKKCVNVSLFLVIAVVLFSCTNSKQKDSVSEQKFDSSSIVNPSWLKKRQHETVFLDVNDRAIFLDSAEYSMQDLEKQLYSILSNNYLDTQEQSQRIITINIGYDNQSESTSIILTDALQLLEDLYMRIWNMKAQVIYKKEFNQLSEPERRMVTQKIPWMVTEREPEGF